MNGHELFLAINWEVPFFIICGVVALAWLILRTKAFSDWGKKK